MFELAKMGKTDDIKVTFNRSAIMSLAWAIKGETGCAMGEALKKAWKVAKISAKKLVALDGCWYGDTYIIGVKLWAKRGMMRGYYNEKHIKSNGNVRPLFDLGTYSDLAA